MPGNFQYNNQLKSVEQCFTLEKTLQENKVQSEGISELAHPDIPAKKIGGSDVGKDRLDSDEV